MSHRRTPVCKLGQRLVMSPKLGYSGAYQVLRHPIVER
jgi:hypothetical protein